MMKIISWIVSGLVGWLAGMAWHGRLTWWMFLCQRFAPCPRCCPCCKEGFWVGRGPGDGWGPRRAAPFPHHLQPWLSSSAGSHSRYSRPCYHCRPAAGDGSCQKGTVQETIRVPVFVNIFRSVLQIGRNRKKNKKQIEINRFRSFD